MGHSLKRLLRLRLLVEETSRMELEGRAVLAARIERERQRELQLAREGCSLVVTSICDEIATGEQNARRIAGWQTVETAREREEKLGVLAQAAERRVAESRAEFFERRKEREQVESVLESAEEQIRVEQERRQQRDMDDWFGMKQNRAGRSARLAGESSEFPYLESSALANSGNRFALLLARTTACPMRQA